MVGISTDDVETLRKFKQQTGAAFTLLSDPGGKVSKAFVGLYPIPGVDMAKRANIVVGQDGLVKDLVAGNDAVDPSSAVAACPLRKAGS